MIIASLRHLMPFHFVQIENKLTLFLFGFFFVRFSLWNSQFIQISISINLLNCNKLLKYYQMINKIFDCSVKNKNIMDRKRRLNVYLFKWEHFSYFHWNYLFPQNQNPFFFFLFSVQHTQYVVTYRHICIWSVSIA